MSRKLFLGIAIALLLATTTTGCGDGDSSTSAASLSTSTSSETSSALPPTTADGTKTSVAPTSPKRYLTNATALRMDGHDQLQFTFNNGVPGYSAEYVTPPITDEGQGATIAISGDSVLKVVLENAGTIDLSGGMKDYFTGSKRFSPTDTTVISEVVKVSEYEGRLLWGIGTRTKSPFTVTSSGNVLTFTFA